MLSVLPVCGREVESSASAGVRLSVRPQRSEGLPGELHAIELRVETEAPCHVALRIPPSSNLVLRAVERYPVARSGRGVYVQKRLAVFQGVEAGETVMSNILAEVAGEVHPFPPLSLRVTEVSKVPIPAIAGERRIEKQRE